MNDNKICITTTNIRIEQKCLKTNNRNQHQFKTITNMFLPRNIIVEYQKNRQNIFKDIEINNILEIFASKNIYFYTKWNKTFLDCYQNAIKFDNKAKVCNESDETYCKISFNNAILKLSVDNNLININMKADDIKKSELYINDIKIENKDGVLNEFNDLVVYQNNVNLLDSENNSINFNELFTIRLYSLSKKIEIKCTENDSKATQ